MGKELENKIEKTGEPTSFAKNVWRVEDESLQEKYWAQPQKLLENDQSNNERLEEIKENGWEDKWQGEVSGFR